jgi:hypothetical protein
MNASPSEISARMKDLIFEASGKLWSIGQELDLESGKEKMRPSDSSAVWLIVHLAFEKAWSEAHGDPLVPKHSYARQTASDLGWIEPKGEGE